MQEITAAYASGDLHARLQIEPQWIDRADADVARLSPDRLRACAALLKHQATELEGEIQSLCLHPRYVSVVVDGPFGVPEVLDFPGEVQRLDGLIAQLRAARERLVSSEALHEVRGAIRDYRASINGPARRRR